MLSENDTLTGISSLLIGVKSGQVELAQEALLGGSNPNILSKKEKMNALHLSVQRENVSVFRLLAENPLADLNSVNMQFQPSIVIAGTLKNNKKEMINSIISLRKPIDSNLLDQYIFTCVNAFSRKGNPTESDFALLAHYVSRLCGVHVGELINQKHDNNDDRYLIHLCQYSGAKKYNEARGRKIELEGWSAHEFLPIRIFSLFEILVKLEQGSIIVEEKANWCILLRKEILTELETFKIEQERRAIAKSADFSNVERELLYRILAEKLLTNILNNPTKEYCLSGGYQGHAIYVSFIFNEEKNELAIRYDNLGNGAKRRHLIDNGVIYPRTVKIKIVDTESVMLFIKELFSIKSKELPEEPEEPEKPQGPKDSEYNAAKKQYKEDMIKYNEALDKIDDEKDKLLEKFYDDENNFNFEDISSEVFGLPKQQAETCVATSHQVGLLLRLQDKPFYEWVLAEEKRCIVQPNRNSGSLQLDNLQFWDDTWSTFKSPEFSDCCPIESINRFGNNWGMLRLLTSQQEQQEFFKSKDAFERAFNENSYNGFKLFFQHYVLENEAPLIFSALILLKLGLDEKALVDKFIFFKNSMRMFEGVLNFCDSTIEPYIHYFLGIIHYNLSQFELARLSFEKCYYLLNPILKNKKNVMVKNQRHEFLYNPFSDNNQSEIETYQNLVALKKQAHIASGFVKIDTENYQDAVKEFEHTCEQSPIKDGMHHLGQMFTFYPEESLFGRGAIEYFLAKNEKNKFLQKTHFNRALIHLQKVMTGIRATNFPFKAEEYMKKITEELETAAKVAENKTESPTTQSPTMTPLLDTRRRSQPDHSEAESSSKKARMSMTE
jgi:hypothetical protein